MVLDEALRSASPQILRAAGEALAEPRRGGDRAANRKQATIPAGATVLEPVGTAPGLVVAPAEDVRAGVPRRPPSSCSPGRRASCSRCGAGGRAPSAARGARGRAPYPPAHAASVRDPRVGDRRDAARGRTRGLRLGTPGGHDVSETRRDRGRHPLRARRAGAYEAFVRVVASATPDTLFSQDGSTVDEQVAALLRGEDARPARARSPRRSPARAACWPRG